MTSADVFEQIEKMGELPSLPQNLLQIQKVATDERSSADDLAECILQDQALTARVLKVVGSALYQRPDREEVRTVHRAVIVLGFETVRKLALGLSVFDMMSKLSRSPWLVQVSRHSLICGGAAQILAETSRAVDPAEAFITGLLHDIGKVVLLECSPEAMDGALSDQGTGADALAAERAHFGITHDRAGRRLAARWNLPPSLQNVIGDHHDIDPLNPPRRLDPMLATIVYADAMSRFVGTPETAEAEHRILRKAVQVLGIPRSRMDDLLQQVQDQVGDLARSLGVEAEDLTAYGQLVNVEGSVTVAPRSMDAEAVARRTAQQLELYRRVGEGMATGAEPDALLREIMSGAVDILGFERAILLRVCRDERLLKPYCWDGVDAGDLAAQLTLPLTRSTGALALSVLDRRLHHVPAANSPAYGNMAGDELLSLAHCVGFAAAPVHTPSGIEAVIYADGGPGGDDVVAEQATELAGLAQQAGLVLGLMAVRREPAPAL